MTLAVSLGLVLSLFGATGMYLAGKKRWEGWAVGLAAQPVWILFALTVHSWPLILSSLLYGSVYAKNLRRWIAPPDAVSRARFTVDSAGTVVDAR